MTIVAKVNYACLSLIVIYLILTGVTSARITPEAIVGVWLFDEGSGNKAQDFSGKSSDGTLMNNPNWIEGKFGKALKFDGKDDYVQISLPGVFNDIQNNDFTILFWTNVVDISGSGTIWKRLMEARYDNSNYVQFSIQINNGELGINVIASGIERTFMVDSPISADTWYHVAGVWDASADSVKLYLDGVLQSTAGTTPASPGTQKILNLGRRSDGIDLSYFNGTIDEFGIFNVALTLDAILSIMVKGLKSEAAVFPSGKLTTIWASIKLLETF